MTRAIRAADPRWLGRGIRVARQHLREGAARVESPAGRTDGEPVHARTIVQLDGDIVTSWRPEAAGQSTLVAAHLDQVAAAMRSVTAAMAQLMTTVLLLVLAPVALPDEWSIGGVVDRTVPTGVVLGVLAALGWIGARVGDVGARIVGGLTVAVSVGAAVWAWTDGSTARQAVVVGALVLLLAVALAAALVLRRLRAAFR